jgi:hypothetical protein
MKLHVIVILLLVAGGMFFVGRGCGHKTQIEVRIDTLIVRDTVRDTLLVPVERLTVRVDTVWMPSARDTVLREVAVPIERRVYASEDYRAVVEGFRPELVEVELYRKTAIVTTQTTLQSPPQRWGIGVQAGVGFTPKGAVPYVGIGIQYCIVAW